MASAPEPSADRRRFVIAASLLPFLALVLRQWPYYPGAAEGDYAQYILHAQSIAQGRPYVDTGYIFSQYAYLVGPVAYPPGLPLTLAPLIAAVGIRLLWLKAVVVLATVLFAWFAGNYVAKRQGVWVGAAVAVLTAVSLETQYATAAVVADLPFCAVVWGLVVVADRPGAWSVRRALAVTALGALAVAYRVVGVAVGPAVVLYALMRPKEERKVALIPAAIWGTGALVFVLMAPEMVPFGNQILRPPMVYVSRIGEFFLHARNGVLGALLYPFPSDVANDLLHVIFLVPLGVGIVRFLILWRQSFLWAFCASYVGLLMVAPAQEGRYLWPLYPVIHLALIDGATWMLLQARRTLDREWVHSRLFIVSLIVVALSMGRAWLSPPPPSLLGNRDARALFGWVRDLKATSPAEPPRVVFWKPRVLTLATGVPAMALLPARQERVLAELSSKRITHVVTGSLLPQEFADSIMSVVIDRNGEMFTPVYRNGTFVVYRFKAPPPTAPAP